MKEEQHADVQQASIGAASGAGAAVGKTTLTQSLTDPAEGAASATAYTGELPGASTGMNGSHGGHDIKSLFGPPPSGGNAARGAGRNVQGAANVATAQVPPSGMWDQTFGQASTSVGKLGRVQAPKGVFLRERPLPGAPSPSSPVPFNGMVFVERRTNQGSANERWCYAVATELGIAGFCEERYLAIDPPEPTATLHRTAPGERLATIAEAAYGRATDDNNSRLYVQALYLANRDRAGVQLEHVDLSLKDRALRGEDEQRTLEVYKGAKVIAGASLWIPSKPFIEQLKAAGAVTGGSTVVTEAWNTAKDVVSVVVDSAKYMGGFFAGILEGAYNAVVDLFKGAIDMVESVMKVIWHLVTGNPGKVKEIASAWVDKMKAVWEHRGEIADEFLKKWNAENAFDRGLFQGEVLGWVIMTVLLVLVTMGENAPSAMSGITTRWPQLVKLLQTVDTLGDVTTYLGAAVKAAKLPGRAAKYVAGKLGRAERAAGHVAETAGKDAARTGEKTEQAVPHSASDAEKSAKPKSPTDSITVAGYAQHPRLYPWRKNADGAVRTAEEAVEIARAHGVEIPDDILIMKMKGGHLPDNTYARYFSHQGTDPKKMITWEEFLDKDLDELVVSVNPKVFESDEAIVAILGHEMHELNSLRKLFEESGGTMSMQRLRNLINPGIAKNLHDQAWDVADRLVAAMRKAGTP